MSQPLALIQLVSEQTMQNLLPVLRLRPTALVHVATPKTAIRSEWIANAARQAGIKPKLKTISMRAMPSMQETFNEVREAIATARDAGQTPIVNFTGGTKLMSIGAYAAAFKQEHRTMSFYVDTEHELFSDGRTAPGLTELMENDFSFSALRKALNVNMIAVANGRERVTGGQDWKPFLPLAQHLLDHSEEEQAVHHAIYGGSRNASGAFLARGQTPNYAGGWLKLLDQDLALPPTVLQLAVEAGLVRPSTHPEKCRLPDSTREEIQTLADAQSTKQPVHDFSHRYANATLVPEKTINLLGGGWWEIIVAETAERSHLFRDLRWSATVGERQRADLEEDILGIDGVQIICISCKRGGVGQKLLSELEQLNNRAQSIGGHFTRRFLAIYLPLRGTLKKAIPQRAQALGIRILGPSDLAQPGAFVRSAVGS